jgi:multicomponent Na+:H+ antiporter subunit A
MLSAILGIFTWSLVAPIVARRLPRFAGWVLAIVPAAATFWFAGFIPEIASGQTVREVVSWRILKNHGTCEGLTGASN